MKELDWINPFQKMYLEYQRCYPNNEKREYGHNLMSCLKAFVILPWIWSRLEDECRSLFLAQCLTDKLVQKPQTEWLSDFEQEVYRLFAGPQYARYLDIDYRTFVFHAKILMDRIAYTTMFSHKVKGIKEDDYNFTEHKKSLRNNEKKVQGLDNEYKSYVLDKTDWYDSLAFTRNFLVAHGFGYNFGVRIDERGHPNIIYIVGHPERERALLTRKELLSKYKDYRQVQDNNWEFNIDSLLSLGAHMTQQEYDSLRGALKRTGGELPDPYDFAREIIAFSNFYSEYYAPKIKNTG